MRKLLQTAVFLLILVVIPVGTTGLFYRKYAVREKKRLNSGILIQMDRNGKEVELDLEEYLVGLLPNQIDLDYEPETLKAQAVIARTNVRRQMEVKDSNRHEQLGFTFTDRAQMDRTLGKQKAAKYRNKIQQAVSATYGQTLQYDNACIDAL